MKSVKLKSNVNMIEVARRFHASNATVLRATYTKGQRFRKIKFDEDMDKATRKEEEDKKRRKLIQPHWNIFYTGDAPNLVGLTTT